MLNVNKQKTVAYLLNTLPLYNRRRNYFYMKNMVNFKNMLSKRNPGVKFVTIHEILEYVKLICTRRKHTTNLLRASG
jgi:hypothetical protein